MNPKELLQEIGRKYPQAWQQFKMFRAGKGKDLPDWPDWCYVPIAAGYAIVSKDFKNPHLLELRLSPAVITAAASWRVSQGVYRFDADLYNALINQPMDDKIPCGVLKRMPEWCIYIETIKATYLGKPIDGFWAHLEWDANTKREELRLIFFRPDTSMAQLSVHLGEWTIEEGLAKMQETANSQASKIGINLNHPDLASYLSEQITPFLQLILYLCSNNADMPQISHPNTRVRMSGQVDVPREPRFWTVGERIGAAIRQYRNASAGSDMEHISGGSHASPRPHVRRAHWHHFWVGPREGKRNLIVHWLPPIPVGTGDEGPVVIHKIREAQK